MTPARPSALIRSARTASATLLCAAALGLGGCASGAATVALPPSEDPPTTSGPASSTPATVVIPLEFITYENARFGFSIDRPRSFVVGGGVQDGDGQIFTTPDESGSLSVWGADNDHGYRPEAYLASLKSEQYGGVVTFDRIRGDVVTISGYTPEDKIFYTRAVVQPHSIQVLRWEYPRAHKEAYDELVERSVASFTSGTPLY